MYVDMVKMNFTGEQLHAKSTYLHAWDFSMPSFLRHYHSICTYRTHSCLGLIDTTTNTEHAAEDHQENLKKNLNWLNIDLACLLLK
jgi:hypothetical protein